MSRTDAQVSYHKKEIGLHQLDAQIRLVEYERGRIYLNMHANSSPQDWKLYDEIGVVLEVIREAKRSLMETPTKRPGFLSKMIVAVYKWAVKGRLDDEVDSHASL